MNARPDPYFTETVPALAGIAESDISPMATTRESFFEISLIRLMKNKLSISYINYTN